jgi:hypothetical protein
MAKDNHTQSGNIYSVPQQQEVTPKSQTSYNQGMKMNNYGDYRGFSQEPRKNQISYMNNKLYGNNETFQVQEEKKEPYKRKKDDLGFMDIEY